MSIKRSRKAEQNSHRPNSRKFSIADLAATLIVSRKDNCHHAKSQTYSRK